jgi:hypothetical protein
MEKLGFLKNNTRSINSVGKAFLYTKKSWLTVIQNVGLGLAGLQLAIFCCCVWAFSKSVDQVNRIHNQLIS